MIYNLNMNFGKPKNPHKGNENAPTEKLLAKIILEFIKTKDSSPYMKMLNMLKQKLINSITNKEKNSGELKDKYSEMLQIWLHHLHGNVKYFNKGREVIVIDTLNIPWEIGDEAIKENILHLTESLVTHENNCIEAVIQCLLMKIKPDMENENREAYKVNPFGLDEATITTNEKVIHIIQRIFEKVPSSFDYLGKLNYLICPYLTFPVREHVRFTYNMLRFGELMPKERKTFFEYIFKNLQDLDLRCPKAELEEDFTDDEDESDSENEDTFAMEIDGEMCNKSVLKSISVNPTCKAGHTLDMLMCVMFRYIHFKMHGGDMKNFHLILQSPELPLEINGCMEGSVKMRSPTSDEVVGCGCGGDRHHFEQLKNLYLDLNFVFRERIMKTTGLSHIQFLMFYLLGSRSALVTEFLGMLNFNFERANSNEEKKIALSYLGSFLARGRCVQFSHVNDTLKILAEWCKNYLRRQIERGSAQENIQSHQSFYSACQTLFYAFTFNHKNYTASEKNLRVAHSFHLNELVLCGLNPLKYCSKTTCENFAKITSIYQLAYCNVVLVNNQKCKMDVASETNTGEHKLQPKDLEIAFPFDPYLLKASKRFIRNHYKKFEGIPDDDREDDKDASIYEDDFNMSFNTPRSLDYSYMSPHIPCI